MNLRRRPPRTALLRRPWLLRPGRPWFRALAVLAMAIGRAQAQPGTVDADYRIELRPHEIPADIAARADGSVYVLIADEPSAGHRLPQVIRFLPDGRRDESFRPEPATASRTYETAKLEVDDRERVYLAGKRFRSAGPRRTTEPPAPAPPLIRRLNPDGSADEGYDTRALPAGRLAAWRLSKSGGAWLAGPDTEGGGSSLVKLGDAGRVGLLPIRVPPDDWFSVCSVLERTNHRVVVVGRIRTSALPDRIGLAQFLADGSLDGAFVPDHPPLTQNLIPSFESAGLLPDDRIVVAGSFPQIGNHVTTNVARYLPSGKVDTTFRAPPMDASVERAWVQPEGRVVIAGKFQVIGGMARPGMARLQSDGSLDPRWVMELPPEASAYAYEMTPNGSLLVGGALGNPREGRGFLVRLHSDGTPRQPPTVVTQPRGGNRRVSGDFLLNPVLRASPPLAFQWFQNGSAIPHATQSLLRFPDLHLVHNGTYSLQVTDAVGSAVTQPALLVVEPTMARPGWPNLKFDFGGGPGKETGTEARCLLPRPDGRLLVGGNFPSWSGTNAGCLLAFDDQGRLDLDFTGRIRTTGPVSVLVEITNHAVLVGGAFIRIGNEPRHGLARLRADATVDPGFLPQLDRFSRVDAIAPLADGGCLAGGSLRRDGRYWSESLIRILPDGRLQSLPHLAGAPSAAKVVLTSATTGGAYVSMTQLPPGLSERLFRVRPDAAMDPEFPALLLTHGNVGHLAPDPSGGVLFAGTASVQDVAGSHAHGIACIRANGRIIEPEPDAPDFRRIGGKRSITTAGRDSAGRLLVGGSGVMRLDDGKPDPSFETRTDGAILAILEDPSGDLYLAGRFDHVWGVPRRSLVRVYGEDRSQPYLLGPFRSENGIEMALETFEGWEYLLELSDAIDATEWRTARVFKGDGQRQVVADASLGVPHRFYRVQVRHMP